MDMEFQVGQSVTFGFDVGGSAPAPPPTPVPSGEVLYGTSDYVLAESGTFADNVLFGDVSEVISYDNGVAYYTTGNNGAAATTLTLANPRTTLIAAKSLAIIMYRSAKTFTASGYTLLADSQVISASDVPMQQVSVYQKSILPAETAGSLTVSQTDNARLDIVNAIIAGSNVTLTLVDNALVASVPYTPPSKTAKRRLYIVSCTRAGSDSITPLFDLGVSGLDMRSGGFNRLKVYYDFDPTVNLTPTLTFSSDYIANSIALMTFDVDGTF